MTIDVEAEIKQQREKIEYDNAEYALEELIECLSNNEAITWDEYQQANFIEYLILGLPFTPIKAVKDNEQLTIIDGKQRVFTLVKFLNNQLTLNGLQVLETLNGFQFKDLPFSRQRRFKRTTCRVIEIAPNSDLSFWV